MTETYATHEAVIGAIRLGLEAAPDDKTARSLVEALLEAALPTPENDHTSVRLLMDTVRERGKWVLTEA